MQQAKREGEWFAVGVLGGNITALYVAPAVITYGSIYVEPQISQVLIRASVDATSQFIVKGEVDLKQTAINGIIPGRSYTNVLANAANNVLNSSMDPNISVEQNIQENTVKAISGSLLFGIGKYAEAVGQANQYGTRFNAFSSALTGVLGNTIDVAIENDVRQ